MDFNTRLKAAAASGDAEAALSAWKGGCVALRLYHDEINKAIPRSVGKWELQEPPYGRIEVSSPSMPTVRIAPDLPRLTDTNAMAAACTLTPCARGGGRGQVKGLGLDDMALTGRKKSLYDF